MSSMRRHKKCAQAVVRSGAVKALRRRPLASSGNSGSDRAWQSELLQEEQVSKLVRSAEDLATVDEWASSQPLPPDEVYFDAVETADLRACKEDVATLQAELDYLSAARLARQTRCEAVQQVLREVALARVEPTAASEQRYLASQMVALDEARKAEAKYQLVLRGMCSRSEQSHRNAKEELEALQRVSAKCDKEMAQAQKHKIGACQAAETLISEVQRMHTTMHRVGQTRRQQLLQLTKLRGTERELMRRAVARETRKLEISQAVAGDLDDDDEAALQELSTVMDLEESRRHGSGQRGVGKRLTDHETIMQDLCEAAGATTADEIINRFFMQREMRDELSARITKYKAKVSDSKQEYKTLSNEQYTVDVTTLPSALLKQIDSVQEDVNVQQADLDRRRSKCAKVAFVVLESSDTMWRCLQRLERSILAMEVAAAGSRSSAVSEAESPRGLLASAARLSAESSKDEEDLRPGDGKGNWEPLKLLEAFDRRVSSLHAFFSRMVPQGMHYAQPAVDIQLSANNFRLSDDVVETQ